MYLNRDVEFIILRDFKKNLKEDLQWKHNLQWEAELFLLSLMP